MSSVVNLVDLGEQRAEAEAAARRAADAGCDWVRGDLELYHDEVTIAQRVDTSLLPAVLQFWRSRFESAAADPSMKRPPYLSLIEARDIVRTAESRLRNIANRDPEHFREVVMRYRTARDDRERAMFLTSAEASAAMLPAGLTLQDNPEPPVREAQNLIQQLRALGLTLTVTDDGRISVSGATLSGSQRARLRDLRNEVVQLLNEPPTETI